MRHNTTPEYQAQVIKEMVNREKRYYCISKRMTKVSADRSSPVSVMAPNAGLSGGDGTLVRKGVCEWMYRIVDHYKLERDVIPVAMSCFDRFVETRPIEELSRSMYQLIALVALHIGIKSHCCTRVNFLPAFAKLAAGRFTIDEIRTMELKMLSDLGWTVNHPTPQAFATEMLLVLSEHVPRKFLETTLEVANYVIECAYLQPEAYEEEHSTLAFAAVLVALRGVHRHILPRSVNIELCNKIESLVPCDFEHANQIGTQMTALFDHENAHLTLKELYQNVDPEGRVYVSVN